jgi:hypothetical protein
VSRVILIALDSVGIDPFGPDPMWPFGPGAAARADGRRRPEGIFPVIAGRRTEPEPEA